MTQVIAQLGNALELSRQMSAQAKAGEWEDLATLELQRRKILNGCFNHPVTATDSAAAQEFILQILSLDKVIQKMGVAERDLISGQLKDLNKNRRAVGAYTAAG